MIYSEIVEKCFIDSEFHILFKNSAISATSFSIKWMKMEKKQINFA